MEHITDSNIKFNFPTAVAVGKFDSLHLGHRDLITKMIKRGCEMGLKTIVFSFNPSPAEVFEEAQPSYVLTSAEKIDILSASPFIGLNFFIEYPFNRVFSQITPDNFLKDFLRARLNCRLLAFGAGYRFGQGRAGNKDTIKTAAPLLGFEFMEIPDVLCGLGSISSSRVRQLIASNDFTGANELMGRPYSISGVVTSGKKLGNKLGFPTANIIIPNRKFTPSDGVYITSVMTDGKLYPSISNIGTNPSFGENIKKCETYIFDFDTELYDKTITVYFYSHIRGEMIFENVDILKARIAEDVIEARTFWAIP